MFRGPIHAGFVRCALSLAGVVISAALSTGCAHRSRAKIPASTLPPAASAPVAVPAPVPAKIGSTESGLASWYGVPYHGRRAASGEIYDMEQLTAAHRTLPFQTWVEVTDLDNGKKVTVRITDRGPFVDGRIIDLSLAAARKIDMVGPGVARVKLKVVAAPENLPDRVVVARTQPASPQNSPPASPPPPAKPDPIRAAPPPLNVLYTVQAAIFADRDRAEAYSAALRLQFADLINEARVVSQAAPGATAPSLVWKVLLGRQLTLDLANQVAARLRDAGATAAVIPEP